MHTNFYSEITLGRTRRQKRNIKLLIVALALIATTMVGLLASIIIGLSQLQ